MSLILAMLFAAQDPISATNKAYNDCLLKLTVSSLDAKKSADEFEKAAGSDCATQEQAYHDAVQQSEVQFGSSASEAKSYADEEVSNLLASMKANYSSFLESGTQPVIN